MNGQTEQIKKEIKRTHRHSVKKKGGMWNLKQRTHDIGKRGRMEKGHGGKDTNPGIEGRYIGIEVHPY